MKIVVTAWYALLVASAIALLLLPEPPVGILGLVCGGLIGTASRLIVDVWMEKPNNTKKEQ